MQTDYMAKFFVCIEIIAHCHANYLRSITKDVSPHRTAVNLIYNFI